MDVVEESGALGRISTSSKNERNWRIINIPSNRLVNPTDYFMVTELCNGTRIGIESELSLETHSFIAFPLAARGRVLGVWLFARDKSPPVGGYIDEDQAVCEELARRAALTIDNIRLYQEAENANHAKENFLAALSHELRTPLTPALLLSEALLSTLSCCQYPLSILTVVLLCCSREVAFYCYRKYQSYS